MAFCFAPRNSTRAHDTPNGSVRSRRCRGGAVITVRPLRHKDSYYGTRKEFRPLQQEAGVRIGVAQRGSQEIDGREEGEERRKIADGEVAHEERPVVGKVFLAEIQADDGGESEALDLGFAASHY